MCQQDFLGWRVAENGEEVVEVRADVDVEGVGGALEDVPSWMLTLLDDLGWVLEEGGEGWRSGVEWMERETRREY
jgi:hypothetical protein